MKKLLILLSLLLISSGCSHSFGRYGLMAVKDGPTSDGKSIVVKSEKQTFLEGKSCTRLISFIPISLGLHHMENAVFDAIEEVRRTDVIGLTNVELTQDWFFVPGIYAQVCWRVRGFAAVAGN